MFLLFVVLAAVLVFVIATATVGRAVARLSNETRPTVFRVPDAVAYIADRLPFEVAAELTHDDVNRIVRWHLDYFAGAGLASKHGQEVGGDAIALDATAVASSDESIDFVVEQALEDGNEVTPLQAVVVVDLLWQYWNEIGAIGPQAATGSAPKSRNGTAPE
jgi:hypothetical protein